MRPRRPGAYSFLDEVPLPTSPTAAVSSALMLFSDWVTRTPNRSTSSRRPLLYVDSVLYRFIRDPASGAVDLIIYDERGARSVIRGDAVPAWLAFARPKGSSARETRMPQGLVRGLRAAPLATRPSIRSAALTIQSARPGCHRADSSAWNPVEGGDARYRAGRPCRRRNGRNGGLLVRYSLENDGNGWLIAEDMFSQFVLAIDGSDRDRPPLESRRDGAAYRTAIKMVTISTAA